MKALSSERSELNKGLYEYIMQRRATHEKLEILYMRSELFQI